MFLCVYWALRLWAKEKAATTTTKRCLQSLLLSHMGWGQHNAYGQKWHWVCKQQSRHMYAYAWHETVFHQACNPFSHVHFFSLLSRFSIFIYSLAALLSCSFFFFFVMQSYKWAKGGRRWLRSSRQKVDDEQANLRDHNVCSQRHHGPHTCRQGGGVSIDRRIQSHMYNGRVYRSSEFHCHNYY